MTTNVDVALQRVEDQIAWYDRKSLWNQRWFKRTKLASVITALAIPVSVGAKAPPLVGAILGSLVALFEVVQQMNQFQQNWITYRSTCELLKHEKFLYLARAGPYKAVNDPSTILAERVEGLVSQEHAKWVTTQERVTKEKNAAMATA